MKIVNLTVDEFDKISDMVYRRTGIRFERQKNYYVSTKVSKRLDELKLEYPEDYIRYLKYGDDDSSEFQAFIDSLTINETYFFRDYNQLKIFAENCLSDVTAKKREKNLRIWSVGCSTGEEPYTLAIILNEMLEDINLFNISIIASDIDRNALKAANEGVYSERSVKEVPEEYLAKWFVSKDGNYHISDRIKSMVTFRNLNLGDSKAIRVESGFDFIFCRNVLIYFDDISRKMVVDHFYAALNRGGYIFLSSGESLSRINPAFKLKRLGGYFVYTKE